MERSHIQFIISTRKQTKPAGAWQKFTTKSEKRKYCFLGRWKERKMKRSPRGGSGLFPKVVSSARSKQQVQATMIESGFERSEGAKTKTSVASQVRKVWHEQEYDQ
jgi:hypothetical protein